MSCEDGIQPLCSETSRRAEARTETLWKLFGSALKDAASVGQSQRIVEPQRRGSGSKKGGKKREKESSIPRVQMILKIS